MIPLVFYTLKCRQRTTTESDYTNTDTQIFLPSEPLLIPLSQIQERATIKQGRLGTEILKTLRIWMSNEQKTSQKCMLSIVLVQ